MRRRTVRLFVFVVSAGLLLTAIAGCFGGGEEAEPTPNIQQTIDAAVAAAKPPDTPTPEPTETPVPTVAPTPDIAATVAAALAAAQTATPPPTVAPPPTVTPAPTDTPVPTNTPLPTLTPTPLPEQSSGPPCIIAGTVTVGNRVPAEGTVVFARSQTDNITVESRTDADGKYVLTITHFDMVFDLLVGSNDSRQDTPVTSRGCRVIRNLSVG